jgi:hypothetical protein
MAAGPYRAHLDVIDVSEPCGERWDRMEGDDFVRFCRVCETNVYDLSARSRDEVEDLLRLYEGAVCVRFRRRADGTVATADCGAARHAHRRGMALRVVHAAGLATGVVGLLTALASATSASLGPDAEAPPPPTDAPPSSYGVEDEGSYIMGRMVAPAPAPNTGPTWVDPSELHLPEGDDGLDG